MGTRDRIVDTKGLMILLGFYKFKTHLPSGSGLASAPPRPSGPRASGCKLHPLKDFWKKKLKKTFLHLFYSIFSILFQKKR